MISNKYVSVQHNLKQLSFEVTEMKDHKSKETQTKGIYKNNELKYGILDKNTTVWLVIPIVSRTEILNGM